MLPVARNNVSNIGFSVKSIESIILWFGQNLQSFYSLGSFYCKNQQEMEELFYQTIKKVHKDLPRYKKEHSFESWVTSIFIQICGELSAGNSMGASEAPNIDIYRAMEKLQNEEKDAILLTYVKGLEKEETTKILQVPIEKLKELLFNGIRSLRKVKSDMDFHGCTSYYSDYIDYLEGSLGRPRKIDFEIHIHHCQHCQEDLGTFQEVMLSLVNLAERSEEVQMPMDFMESIKARFNEENKKRQGKKQKRKKIGLVTVSIFTVLLAIGYFTGAFTSLYYTWTEEDPELRSLLQNGYGERLDLEAESNGVKITIKSVIADDIQTLVYYEVEDTENSNQYFMNYHDGVYVDTEHAVMNSTFLSYNPPDLESNVNGKKNVYSGKMSLFPLIMDNDKITLNINKLHILPEDSSGGYVNNIEFKSGLWSFEIPVTKQPSIEYTLNQETEIEGIPIRFEKLKIAPTATGLQYSIHIGDEKKQFNYLNFNQLKVDDQQLKPDLFGGSPIPAQEEVNWITYETIFEPIINKGKPEEVNVQFESAQLSFFDQLTYMLDVNGEYPQTFEYGGSTMTIEELVVGQPTTMTISNHDIKHRSYESIHFTILGNDNEHIRMEDDLEGVIVDKDGKEYNMNSLSIPYDKIKQPRYFQTVHRMKLRGDNPEESVIPNRLELYGYNTTRYLDDVVKITVE